MPSAIARTKYVCQNLLERKVRGEREQLIQLKAAHAGVNAKAWDTAHASLDRELAKFQKFLKSKARRSAEEEVQQVLFNTCVYVCGVFTYVRVIKNNIPRALLRWGKVRCGLDACAPYYIISETRSIHARRPQWSRPLAVQIRFALPLKKLVEMVVQNVRLLVTCVKQALISANPRDGSSAPRTIPMYKQTSVLFHT